MYHPLLGDLSTLKDEDVERKIGELGKKYGIAARSGNSGLCSQILLTLEAFKEESCNRLNVSRKLSIKNQDKDLDDLINID